MTITAVTVSFVPIFTGFPMTNPQIWFFGGVAASALCCASGQPNLGGLVFFAAVIAALGSFMAKNEKDRK